ncbi:MAG: DUF799 family lipoprotein [Lacunisphaera sp.]|nr:DUF799 family lipoprotein [Lacunisphaera sp.]
MNSLTCKQPLLRALFLSLAMLVLSGCVTRVMVTKGQKYPLLYEEHPNTVVVLPPINNTTAADAKEYYSTTIAQPLAFSGFYVVPIEPTAEILKGQGLYDTEILMNQPVAKFAEYFGADAVLYTTITKWNKSYAVLASTLTVSIDAKLKSTKSERTLWEYSGTLVADLSANSNSGNPLVDLIVKAVVTSLNTALADYVPYAQLANTQMLQSIPVGKYHPRHGQDQADQIQDLRLGKDYK